MEPLTRKIVCWKCGDEMGECLAKRTTRPLKSRRLCLPCRTDHLDTMVARNKSERMRSSNSSRMKKNNPMFCDETRRKASETAKAKFARGERVSPFQDAQKLREIRSRIPPISEEHRRRLSLRMTEKNPMADEATRRKVAETLRRRIASGEITFPRGEDHWLWKGNRDFNNSVRAQLYSVWTIKVIERDGFACTNCGARGDLNSHHVRPLRELIAVVKKKHGIRTFLEIESSKWQPYIQEVIDLHTLEDGITLCPPCHSKIDDQFFAKNGGRKGADGA